MLATHPLLGNACVACIGCSNQRVMRNRGAYLVFNYWKSFLSKLANRYLLFSLLSSLYTLVRAPFAGNISEQKKSVDPFPVSRKKCRSISSFDKKRHFLSIHFLLELSTHFLLVLSIHFQKLCRSISVAPLVYVCYWYLKGCVLACLLHVYFVLKA
jgi:hypothetical protein